MRPVSLLNRIKDALAALQRIHTIQRTTNKPSASGYRLSTINYRLSTIFLVFVIFIFQITTLFSVSPTTVLAQQAPFNAYLPIVLKPELITPTAVPTAVPTATPPAGNFNVDGSWLGTTDQGRKIAFTITNHAFSSFTNSYKIGGCGLETTTTYSKPETFTGNSFEHSTDGNFYYPFTGNYTIVARGSFSSTTAASGSMHVYDSRCGSIDVNWTATKQ